MTDAPVAGPLALDLELESRIRRDLGRGKRLVLLTWVAALASLVLGLVSIRQSALLVSIDRHLVTTEEIQATGQGFDLVRLPLLLVLVAGILVGVRWWRGAIASMRDLQARGVVEGPAPRSRLERLGLPWRAAGMPADRASWADLRVGSGRRVARLAFVAVAVAGLVGLVAATALGVATEAAASRWWRVVIGIDGGLWVAAFVLLGGAIDAARWREAVAARSIGVVIPLVDPPGRTLIRLVPPMLVFGAAALAMTGRPDPWFVPCPDVTLSCDGILVPADHDGGSNATIWLVYAVHHAVGAPKGTLAVAVGGPGGSGLAESADRLATFDPVLVRDYDLLFWDGRGIGASEGRDCPDAGRDYASAKPGLAAAQSFTDACIRESGVPPADVARYSTHQTAEDLESIRDHLGLDRFALYGESYGTLLAQTYAASHPDRLSALILDGAVDVSRTANEFWADAATSFERTLQDTFAACGRAASCRADLPDPAATFDRAIDRFRNPRDVSYADSDGTVRSHSVDLAGLEGSIGQLLYVPTGRALVLRALAAADRGDDVPLARLGDSIGSGDRPGVSEFAYHAMMCADYRVSPTDDPHDLAAVEAYARERGIPALRMGIVYGSQFSCLAWPFQPASSARPALLTSTPFPVIVLAAADDPITPLDRARAIANRLTDGYLITTSGGPHITFGRGTRCVDAPIVALLVDAKRPASRTIECPGDVISTYAGLTPSTAAGYDDDALAAMVATRTEVFADPAVALWSGRGDLRVGCPAGGFFALTGLTTKDDIRFAACEFVPDLPLTGLGTVDPVSGAVHWKVTLPDGSLEYDATPNRGHVTGTWESRAVDQSG